MWEIQIKTTSYLLNWLLSKRQEITMLVRMWRKRNFCIVVGNINCCSHHGKKHRGVKTNLVKFN